MADRASATPLLALDAVVLDTETTSLDPARARLLEIGAYRLTAGRIDTARRFHSLVHPGEPVSPESTRIHGIDDARLAGAPDFSAAWAAFREYLNDSVVIGHTIEYDIAVFAAECRRAGIDFRPPRILDVRWFAEMIEPNLPGFSIEAVAAWLGIPVEDRHSALGDAITTARIFVALVPRLREGGIRTLAEAEAACRVFTDAMTARHQAGWLDRRIEPARVDTVRTLERLDPYPYRHRIRDVMSQPPIFIAPGSPVKAAMDLLMSKRVSSVFVAPVAKASKVDAHVVPEVGILTERDILRAVARDGARALDTPVEAVAHWPLQAVPADAFVYRAIGRMARLKVRHLGVVDESGELIGALSSRDLLRLRAGEAVALGDEIDEAVDTHELASAWAKLPAVAAALHEEGVDARDVAAVISRELTALTRRAAMIGEERLKAAGEGTPPVSYAVLVLGSGGRGESLLAMDQDNAIVFAEGDPDGPEDRWFEKLGTHIADILHEVGVPYCKGGIMARNAPWRGSAKVWRERVAEWIGRSNPQDLLNVDIFFDLRAAHGDGALAENLWRDALEAARGQSAFLKLLADAKGEVDPPIGFFGIKTDSGRVDLKRGGLFGIVASARILSLRYHVVERATRARLEGVKALKVGAERDLDAWIEAHRVIVNAILGQQLVDIAAGRPPSNAVEPRRLSRGEQDELKESLKNLKHIDDTVRDLLTGR